MSMLFLRVFYVQIFGENNKVVPESILASEKEEEENDTTMHTPRKCDPKSTDILPICAFFIAPVIAAPRPTCKFHLVCPRFPHAEPTQSTIHQGQCCLLLPSPCVVLHVRSSRPTHWHRRIQSRILAWGKQTVGEACVVSPSMSAAYP